MGSRRQIGISHLLVVPHATDHYKRYIVIVKDIIADDFGHGPFRVYCPLMTAILCRAEVDLAVIARALGEPEVWTAPLCVFARGLFCMLHIT